MHLGTPDHNSDCSEASASTRRILGERLHGVPRAAAVEFLRSML